MKASESPRPSCIDCVRKHIGQAAVLFQEALQGYPEHRWLAIGHLAEAEAEIQELCSDFAGRLRNERRKSETGDYIPDCVSLLNIADSLNATYGCDKIPDRISKQEGKKMDKIARELIKVVKEFMASPSGIVKDSERALDVLEELSDNIEDSIETFSLHYRMARLDPEVKNQFVLFAKAKKGLEHAGKVFSNLEKALELYPEDKTVVRALKDAEVMVKRFTRHQSDARKVISTLSKKQMPPGLKGYSNSIIRIVRGKFTNPKDLDVVPWMEDSYLGNTIHYVILQVKGTNSLTYDGLPVRLELREDVGGREPAGVNEHGRSIQMSAKQAAETFLDKLRSWNGLKEKDDGKRDKVREGVKSAISLASRSLGFSGTESPTSNGSGLRVSGGYRSNSLPKGGATAVGEHEYDDMVKDEIVRFKNKLEPLLSPYKTGIKGVEYYDSEKSWMYVTVELK